MRPGRFAGDKLRTNIGARSGRNLTRLATLVILTALAASPAVAADIETVIGLESQENAKSRSSQKRIDKIDDQTDTMAAEYRSVIDQTESLRVYNAQLSKLIDSQTEELVSLEDQISNVTVIGREVTPLMLRMVDALDSFVQLDIPLLLSERSERVAGLRDLMDRADVDDSEKYRRIMEAYQIENEYGRTIESYQETMNMGGQERTLEFLRVGRIALLYQTLDGSEVGAWDQKQQAWVQLPDEYSDSIRKGVRIARKQLAPDLIRLPVAAPEDAR